MHSSCSCADVGQRGRVDIRFGHARISVIAVAFL